MRHFVKIWLVSLVGLSSVELYSQDSTAVTDLIFNGYIKYLQSAVFEDLKGDWMTSGMVHNRLNFKFLSGSRFTAALEVRNRLIYGEMLNDYPDYKQLFDVDNGVLDLSKNLINQSYVLNTSIDRIWGAYTTDRYQIRVGRQRINWGQTFVWNPNDIFNSYSYFDFDYEERPGSDAVRLQYFVGAVSEAECAVKINSEHKLTAAALYRFNRFNYDFQFMGGMVDEVDYVIGTGWAGQLFDGGFRGEVSYFYPIDNHDESAVLIGSVGYDYTFKNSLFLQSELLYNGYQQASGNFALSGLSNRYMGVKELFLSDVSVFVSVSYPITPLINASAAGIENFNAGLFFIIPSINVSVFENTELMLTAQILKAYGEPKAIPDMNVVYLRLKYSF